MGTYHMRIIFPYSLLRTSKLCLFAGGQALFSASKDAAAPIDESGVESIPLPGL